MPSTGLCWQNSLDKRVVEDGNNRNDLKLMVYSEEAFFLLFDDCVNSVKLLPNRSSALTLFFNLDGEIF